jgi:hypothetical protein
MAQIKNLITGDIFTVANTPIFDNGVWECGDQRFTDPIGDQYELVAPILPTIVFDYPVAIAVNTAATVNVSVVNASDNSQLTVNETYYVPLINTLTGAFEKMLVVPVVEGIGSVVFTPASSGVYSIKVEHILPAPTAAFSEVPNIAVYA